MSKLDLNKIGRTVEVGIKKHTPGILTGIGIAGMITSTVLAVKATPKALYLLEEKKADEEVDKLPPIEVVKTCWKCYVPAALTTILSVTALIGSNTVNARRNAALGAACSLSEAALREYREKVIETIGEKKEQSVQDAIAKDRIEKNPVTNNEVIITDTRSNTLCYEGLSGRYFKSDIEKLRRAENELNRQMIQELYVSLNDFYYEIGLDGTKMGEQLGWNIDKEFISLTFSSQIAEDGTPCLVINYSNPPVYNYDHY